MEKDTNPKDALGTAKWRQFMTVPRQVLWEVGVGMLEGALKYGRHNYRGAGVRASVYLDAAYGHLDQFCEGEDVDKDSGLSHVTKAITSLIVLRDAMMNDMWTDDRPPKIKDLDGVRDALQALVAKNFETYADKNPHHYTEVDDPAPYREDTVKLGTNAPKRDIHTIDEELKGAIAYFDKLDVWNAGPEHVEDDKILRKATMAPPAPITGYENRLGTLSWLPTDVIEQLGDDDPSKIETIHHKSPRYDVDHVVQGLTQKQLDNLALGLFKGKYDTGRFTKHQIETMLRRRAILQIRTQPLRWATIEFATGGARRIYTRLTSDQWFIAAPGCRVTFDPPGTSYIPRSFA